MESADEAGVRAAWLYYMEGLTQDAVAARLGLTRLKVNRLLAEARASGVVHISIHAKLSGCLALESRLKTECGLDEAVVVPTPQDPAQIPHVLGRAAGAYLSRQLETRSIQAIGVGWGATLRETIRYVKPGRWPALHVNSLMGGLTRGLEINTFDTASALASRLDARCSYLAAPLYTGSQQSRDTLISQDVFKESFDAMASNDMALLSVGDLSDRSLLIRYGLPKDVTAQSLADAGAVGDILGQFIDAQGLPVQHPLSGRVMSPPLSVLAAIPQVVVASGGLHKAAILAAVLRRGLVNVLVSDEQTVAQALALYHGDA